MPSEPVRGWPEGFAAGAQPRRALLRLASLKSLAPRALHELAWRVGSAPACVAAIREGHAGSAGDREWLDRADPDGVAARLQACGATFVCPGDPGYPPALR